MRRDLEYLFDRYRRRGDLSALGRVFDRTGHDLLRLALHLARDPDDAEDLVQATFLTAIDRAAGYDRGRPLRPWLAGILARHAANLRRARGRRAGSEEGLAQLPWCGPDPSAGAGARELEEGLASALARIGPPHREVLEACLLRGERPEEVARHLGRAPGTVRAQLHRGLERLRAILPAGVGAGLGLCWPVSLPRGLDAVRATVLRHGSHAAATTVPASGLAAGILLGGIVIGKKTALAGTAAAVLTAGLWISDGPRLTTVEPERPAGPATGERSARLVAPALGAVPTETRKGKGTPEATSARTAAGTGRLLVRGWLRGVAPEHAPGFELQLVGRGELEAVAQQDQLLRVALVQHQFENPRTDARVVSRSAPSSPLVPKGVAIRRDGRFELDLTRSFLDAEPEQHVEYDLVARHEVHLDAHAPVTLGPDDARRLRAGRDVVREVDLAPRPAAVLRGEARRSRRAVDDESVQITMTTRFAGSGGSSAVLDLRDVLKVEGGSTTVFPSKARFVITYGSHPVHLALVRPGAREPVAVTNVGRGAFEFRVPAGGPFAVVALSEGLPPVTVLTHLELLAVTELEDPIELTAGPELAGMVEDHGLHPDGGIALVARRKPRDDEPPLDWKGLAWRGDAAVRRRAATETRRDGGFVFTGLSSGDHEVGLDLGRHHLLEGSGELAARVDSPVPATDLQLELPAAVVDVRVEHLPGPEGEEGEEGPPECWLTVEDPEGNALGRAPVGPEGRLELLCLPHRSLVLRAEQEGARFEPLEVTAPALGGRSTATLARAE